MSCETTQVAARNKGVAIPEPTIAEGARRAKQSIVITRVELNDLGHHVVEVCGGRDAILGWTETTSIRDCWEVVEVALLGSQRVVVVPYPSAWRTKRRPSTAVVGVGDGVAILEERASQVVGKPTLVADFGKAIYRPVVVVCRLTSTGSCTRRIHRLGKGSPPSNEETRKDSKKLTHGDLDDSKIHHKTPINNNIISTKTNYITTTNKDLTSRAVTQTTTDLVDVLDNLVDNPLDFLWQSHEKQCVWQRKSSHLWMDELPRFRRAHQDPARAA